MIKLAKKKSKSDWIEIDGIKLLVDYPTNAQQMLLQEIMLDNSLGEESKRLRYARNYLRYTIKDWQGIDDKCLLIDGILEKELWESLVVDPLQTLTLFGKVFDELNFDETDKKKL